MLMKKLIIICILILATMNIFSQGQDEFQQDESVPKFVYCEIVGVARFLNPNKVTVQLDFGEEMKAWTDNRIRDPKTGKPIVFNSMVDALNYMGERGWEFVQAYAVTTSNQNVYHYLLKKPFTNLDRETKDYIINRRR